MKKHIPDTEDYYATNNGRIFKGDTEVAQCLDRLKNGYKQCSIKIRGKYQKQKVHRLIAMTFIGNIKGLVVNHIDGIKTNNNENNLEVITHYENVQHAKTLPSYKEGITKRAKSNMKLSLSQQNEMKLIANDFSLNGLAEKYNIGRTTVSDYIIRLGIVRTKRVNQYS